MTTAKLEPGRIAHVRQHRYLIEKVVQSPEEATLVNLSCLDDFEQIPEIHPQILSRSTVRDLHCQG